MIDSKTGPQGGDEPLDAFPKEVIELIFERGAGELINRIEGLFEVEEVIPNTFLDYTDFLGQNDHVPIVYSNHLTLADGIGFALLHKGLSSRIEREYGKQISFTLPIALSLAKGQQGSGEEATIQLLFETLSPELQQRGIKLVPIPSKSDLAKRSIDDAVVREHSNNVEQILTSLGPENGLMIYPEGTSEGGRKDEYGRQKGIQSPPNGNENMLLEAAREVLKQGHTGAALLPVGFVNTHRILHPGPGPYAPYPKAAQAMISGDPTEIAKMRLGRPVIVEDLESIPSIDDAMLAVADLLPDELCGNYR